MKIEITTQKFRLTQALRQRVERRLHFALNRFANRIGTVRVRLADINGPRGGSDKKCHIAIGLLPARRLFVEAVEDDLYRAIDLAIERAGRAVGRQLTRLRDYREGGPYRSGAESSAG